MNPTAIYSKSGKGVQEASGKTSQLSRPDRAVLSAIDGRATLADVAQKCGKTFDSAFEKLIGELDKNGFVREVSPGTAGPKPAGGAKPAGKATAPMDAGSDLDFTAAMSAPSKGKPPPPPQAPPRPAPPPKQSATIPPPPPPPSAAEKVKAEQVAKTQQDAFAKAREDAERKAQAERDRVKAESEAKIRAETEGKLRAEAEAKAKADAEARIAAEAAVKIKAAQDAAARVAAEAKAKAEAETKKAREEADRVRRDAEEKLRREQEEMKRKLEEERRAREEAERKAKEEARRLEEERRKLEEARKREEAERAERRKREEEEEAARRAERKKREEEEEERAEAERAARKKREEEEEARERAERKKREEEEEARERAEKAMRDARRKAQEREEEAAEEEEKPKPKKKKEKEPEAAKPAGGGFSDTLLADLDSFNTREETEQKEREEAERKAKEEAVRRRLEEEERRAKEEAERKAREEKERAKREEQEAKRREEEDLKDRQQREEQRLKDEEEKRKQEAEERERKSRKDEELTAKATGRTTDAFAAEAELKKRRERQLGPVHREAKAERGEKKGWGKPIAGVLFLLLMVGVGVVHVMPIGTEEYERAATEALGRPVKINSAGLSLVTGLQLKFSGVTVGETKIATVRTTPEFGALTGPKKAFSRIEIEGLKLAQSEVGDGLFAKVKADNFSVERLVFKQLELTGPLAMPKGLEVELFYDAEGGLRAATVRGPEALVVKAVPKGSAMEFEMNASSFTLPFASELSLSKFAAKGSASPQGLSVSEWEGQVLNGTVSGTANVRWADGYSADGVITARGINAAVFAPALLSDGRAEGSGKFSMRGAEPAKLASGGRLDGSFTVTRGVLGSIDLSRAIQTGGKQATGRTQFNEMNGQATYSGGALTLRSVTLSAGQLNAGASVDIAANGALSGRIVADVKVAAQTLRANLNLGGTLKEPQVRN